MPTSHRCCFRDCDRVGAAPMRLEISPPPDAEPITAWAHEECFSRARESSVQPDNPREHGRIPGQARCAFCGLALPVIGSHPYCFDAGDFSPPQRFWSHAKCIADRLLSSVVVDRR